MKLLLTLFILTYSKFDPCGYVGSSNDPEIEQKCFDASPDCCFFAWSFQSYVYYSCTSKTKMLNQRSYQNLTDSMIYDLDDGLYETIRKIIYSKCNNEDDIITNHNTEVPNVVKNTGLYNNINKDL
jgi:hypothetical protein